MTLRRIRLSAVVLVLTVCFLAVGAAQPAVNSAAGTRGAAPAGAAAVKASPANWVFEGCWTQFSAGPCRDIFRDEQGGHHICRECGTTGNPNNKKCNPISSQTLASGFWCS